MNDEELLVVTLARQIWRKRGQIWLFSENKKCGRLADIYFLFGGPASTFNLTYWQRRSLSVTVGPGDEDRDELHNKVILKKDFEKFILIKIDGNNFRLDISP